MFTVYKCIISLFLIVCVLRDADATVEEKVSSPRDDVLNNTILNSNATAEEKLSSTNMASIISTPKDDVLNNAILNSNDTAGEKLSSTNMANINTSIDDVLNNAILNSNDTAGEKLSSTNMANIHKSIDDVLNNAILDSSPRELRNLHHITSTNSTDEKVTNGTLIEGNLHPNTSITSLNTTEHVGNTNGNEITNKKDHVEAIGNHTHYIQPGKTQNISITSINTTEHVGNTNGNETNNKKDHVEAIGNHTYDFQPGKTDNHNPYTDVLETTDHLINITTNKTGETSQLTNKTTDEPVETKLHETLHEMKNKDNITTENPNCELVENSKKIFVGHEVVKTQNNSHKIDEKANDTVCNATIHASHEDIRVTNEPNVHGNEHNTTSNVSIDHMIPRILFEGSVTPLIFNSLPFLIQSPSKTRAMENVSNYQTNVKPFIYYRQYNDKTNEIRPKPITPHLNDPQVCIKKCPKSLVSIEMQIEEDLKVCTGILLIENFVLTSGSCIPQDWRPHFASNPWTITVSPILATNSHPIKTLKVRYYNSEGRNWIEQTDVIVLQVDTGPEQVPKKSGRGDAQEKTKEEMQMVAMNYRRNKTVDWVRSSFDPSKMLVDVEECYLYVFSKRKLTDVRKKPGADYDLYYDEDYKAESSRKYDLIKLRIGRLVLKGNRTVMGIKSSKLQFFVYTLKRLHYNTGVVYCDETFDSLLYGSLPACKNNSFQSSGSARLHRNSKPDDNPHEESFNLEPQLKNRSQNVAKYYPRKKLGAGLNKSIEDKPVLLGALDSDIINIKIDLDRVKPEIIAVKQRRDTSETEENCHNTTVFVFLDLFTMFYDLNRFIYQFNPKMMELSIHEDYMDVDQKTEGGTQAVCINVVLFCTLLVILFI